MNLPKMKDPFNFDWNKTGTNIGSICTSLSPPRHFFPPSPPPPNGVVFFVTQCCLIGFFGGAFFGFYERKWSCKKWQ